MNTKFRIFLAMCVLIVSTAGMAYSDLIYKGDLGPGNYTIVDDSSETGVFTIGSAAAGVDANEIDTSAIYGTKGINHMVVSLKTSPKVDGVVRAAASALDSGAVTVFTQGSNDRIYWKDIDTTTAVDSLAVSEEIWFKERTYRYVRWIAKPGTKLDDSGMSAVLKVNMVQR